MAALLSLPLTAAGTLVMVIAPILAIALFHRDTRHLVVEWWRDTFPPRERTQTSKQ